MQQEDQARKGSEQSPLVCPLLSIGTKPTPCIASSCALWMAQSERYQDSGCVLVLAIYALHQQAEQA